MKKYLWLALLWAWGPAWPFDRQLLLGRWHCVLSADPQILKAQRLFKSVHISSLNEYGADGQLRESGQIQVMLVRGPTFNYSYRGQGRWHLSHGQLARALATVQLERRHELATRRWLTVNGASRRLELALFKSLQEVLGGAGRSEILELNRQSLQLRAAEFSGSCTRL